MFESAAAGDQQIGRKASAAKKAQQSQQAAGRGRQWGLAPVIMGHYFAGKNHYDCYFWLKMPKFFRAKCFPANFVILAPKMLKNFAPAALFGPLRGPAGPAGAFATAAGPGRRPGRVYGSPAGGQRRIKASSQAYAGWPDAAGWYTSCTRVAAMLRRPDGPESASQAALAAGPAAAAPWPAGHLAAGACLLRA